MFYRLALAFFSLCFAGGIASAQMKPVLTVYTYSSFAGKYGPGKIVKERFEAVCNCELTWVTAEDAGSLVGRLRLEGEGTKADAVVGLDMNLAAEAKALNIFAPHGVDVAGLTLPVAWTDDTFIPYDWGYLAFVYDATKLPQPPKSLKELVEDPSGPKVVLQDPRTSAPGLGFLLWMQKVYGDRSDAAWAQLKPRVVTFTKGWSEAYGLFLKGEADMVMSYTTSPAYHVVIEKKDQYKAASFEEGHYLHIELAGMTRTSKNPELARKFMDFVLSEAFQSAMPEGNWMMPAKAPKSGLPEAFKDIIEPSKALLFTPAEVQANRRAFVDSWLNATAR
ncbi:thiamine ABC transporter substrate binding subunit [Microvirga sp. 17 mud 1-3]|uniref:thiamine ABC transporter substrate binding subunit n=1 Tax=Microvirga sp. 17 mud 1-3 TaxID=2082949 RepID=UPI000D6D37B2|nr:thiamine ABC transporter substrate binding subunit [Microvirga sp. 17 mud 1-3]AWM85837.1 thiamine ABC transporter substrate binding subunit [Microvirga sp. 17 mud 1-3]